MRQEQIRGLKPALKKGYAAFDGTADLYVYFYELGLRLLRPGGRLSYVVTNKWLRAGYAEQLRGLLSERAWLEAVTDFGHAKRFFPGADVFPCVIVACRPDGSDEAETTEVCQIPRDVVRLDRVSQQVKDMAFALPRAVFSKKAWSLDPPEVAALMDKIRRAGVPLKDHASTKPYRGILTGFNEAFLIDTPTRDALVAADPSCAGIINPYLRGQDVERWTPRWRNLWMIVMKSSSDFSWPWADAEHGAEQIFANTYPSLHAHFKLHEEKLRNRQDHGRYWWELRPCAYYAEFDKPKLMYQAIQYHAKYSYDDRKFIGNNKTYIITSDDHFLLSSLNSPVFWWFSWRFFVHMKDEALSNDGTVIEHSPIPRPSHSQQEVAEQAVRQLIRLQRDNSEACTLLSDWYANVLEIATPNRDLLQPFNLSSDAFVEQIHKARGKRKPLSAAGIKAVRDEYTATVQPMQAKLHAAERLERQLSDLVNEAYGLTPEEVRLMWDTAPPRMPLTPEADEPIAADEEAAD